jgi:hypothetical protein
MHQKRAQEEMAVDQHIHSVTDNYLIASIFLVTAHNRNKKIG